MFDVWLQRWNLRADGEPILTHSSRLLPVRLAGGTAAMLKIAVAEEERRGNRLMCRWEGRGVAPVLACAGAALLLERAEENMSLHAIVLQGEDDAASRILCQVAAQLHTFHQAPPPQLIPLEHWFRALDTAARRQGGILAVCTDTALELLAAPQDVVALHGDLHHGNILNFGTRGWLAIDPKGLRGERGFEYANLFCNPEPALALEPARFARRLDVVTKTAHLERRRLLQWILAYAGLSAAWFLEDGETGETPLAVAALAAARLAE